MADDITKKLLRMKEEIETAKIESAQVQGAIDQNLKRLKDEFGVSSLARAKQKLDKLKDQEADLDKQIEKAVDKLEADYEW